jgi:hypothetical protein
MGRLLRSGAIALGFLYIFILSRRATLARGGEDLPGISVALALLSLIFYAGAIAAKRVRGADARLQTDLLLGLGSGCILAILWRAGIFAALGG